MVDIYLISGKSLNGKDSLYEMCIDSGWVRASFADVLKEVVSKLYNFTYEQMFGNLKDVMDERYINLVDDSISSEYKPFLTPRRILQIFGQDQRKLFPDIWASYLFNIKIPELIASGASKIAITDVRFKNEIAVAEKLKPTNSRLIKVRIVRPGIVAKTNHLDISEIDLDDYSQWDFLIQNDGSLKDLQEKGYEMLSLVDMCDY